MGKEEVSFMGLFDANNVKCAEVRKLVEEQQYKKALEILEKININKVKSIADLNVFAHIYQKSGMYEEARDILYKIYEKRPNKRVIYKLVYLAILVSDFEEAEALYEEYVEIAEGTAEQYILRYGLDKAERKDYMVRIQSLLKIKELDYTEDWAYELAKTYHKAGMAQECVDECTDIILWFGSGKIVEKATLLRAYYIDGVEVLQSYGIALNEEGQYYYDEATAQAYYKANHPMTSAGQNTQNLSAQISYITEQQRQLSIHNELTRDLEPTINIQQAIMQETGGNPAFQEELRHMIGDNIDTAEIRYQERATRDKQAQEIENIQKMEAERQAREVQQNIAVQSEMQQGYEDRQMNMHQTEYMPQQMYEEQLPDLSDMEDVDAIMQEKEKQQEDLGDIPTTVLVEDIFKEMSQMAEENEKSKNSRKIKKKQSNAHISKKEKQQPEDENKADTPKDENMVKRTKRFSLFSRKRKGKQSENASRLIQIPREEAKQMIEKEERTRREEELQQEALKKEKEKKRIEEATKMEAEFLDDLSNTKNLFGKLRGKNNKAKEESAAIEKEQNILASLTETPLMKKEWNASIEVPEEVQQMKESEGTLKENVKAKPKPFTKKEWLEKTKEVSQKVEEAKKEGRAKEKAVIGDTISIKIKPKDTKIVIDGMDLTENFGSYAEQPRVRAQLLKELTRMKEGEHPLHILLSGKDDEQTMEFIRSLGKAIKAMGILPSHRIASIDADKLNKIQLADKQDSLKNGCVAIKNAGKITADTAQSILNMIEEFEDEVIVILVDENSSLDFLMAEYPALAKYFKYNLAI